MLMNSNEYLSIVESIKKEIRTAQYRATIRVNRELLMLYHSIGDIINLLVTSSTNIKLGETSSSKILLLTSNYLSRMPPATL